MEFEPYEFMEERFGKMCLVYRCYRCSTPKTVQVADRKTHNNYHNHVEAGLPNPYAKFLDRW